MAPEYPLRLIVLTMDGDGNTFRTEAEYIEHDQDKRLRVRWADMSKPAGYKAVGAGAVFVQEFDGVMFLGPSEIQVDDLGDRRYRWQQGTTPGVPWVMIVLVLPRGFSLRAARPPVAAAKHFDDRLAVYWCVEGDKSGRAIVEWHLRPVGAPLKEEVQRLNSSSSLEDLPEHTLLDVKTASDEIPLSSLTVFLCHDSDDKPQVRQLRDRLKADGCDPWLDEDRVLPGEQWAYAIRAGVGGSNLVLVCLSQRSVKKVGFLQKELKFVLEVAEEHPEGSIFVVPIRLEAVPIPESLSGLQYLDYFAEGAHAKLLKALHKRASQVVNAGIRR